MAHIIEQRLTVNEDGTTKVTPMTLSGYVKHQWYSSRFSDITIRIPGKDLRLHKVILARHAFFNDVLERTKSTEFQASVRMETDEGSVEYFREHSVAFEFALMFLYGYTYMECYASMSDKLDFIVLREIFKIANKYGFLDLKREAAKGFDAALAEWLVREDVFEIRPMWEAIRLIFEEDSQDKDEAYWLKDYVIGTLQKHSRVLLQQQAKMERVLQICPTLPTSLSMHGRLRPDPSMSTIPYSSSGEKEDLNTRRKRARMNE